MKIFAIRDESAETQKDLAYLLYYELESFDCQMTELSYTHTFHLFYNFIIT